MHLSHHFRGCPFVVHFYHLSLIMIVHSYILYYNLTAISYSCFSTMAAIVLVVIIVISY